MLIITITSNPMYTHACTRSGIRPIHGVANRIPTSPQRQHRKRQQIHIPDKPRPRSVSLKPASAMYVSVPASATGTLSGLAMDVAWDMLNPHRRNNGTVMTLPPTPRNVAMAPMPTPPADISAIQSTWDDAFVMDEEAASEQAVDDGHAEVGDEGVANDLAADPHRGDRADDRALAMKPPRGHR
jgi:hypothetical protein